MLEHHDIWLFEIKHVFFYYYLPTVRCDSVNHSEMMRIQIQIDINKLLTRNKFTNETVALPSNLVYNKIINLVSSQADSKCISKQ